MSPLAFVHSLIKFALCIGLAGGLIDLTIGMGKRAEKATNVSLINLKQLNDSLTRPRN